MKHCTIDMLKTRLFMETALLEISSAHNFGACTNVSCICMIWDQKNMLRLNDLMAVYVHNISLVFLLMLSPLRNESENENKINQKSSLHIKVISYISSIWIIKKCLKNWDF